MKIDGTYYWNVLSVVLHIIAKNIRNKIGIISLVLGISLSVSGQENTKPDFMWGNVSYFNLSVGESIFYKSKEIKLLQLKNHFNVLEVDNDTLWLKVSRISLPNSTKGIRLFVADNRNVKSITDDFSVHGLLKKDALLCISDMDKKMLEPGKYIFPISFNDGFLWNAQEDNYMYSYMGETTDGFYRSYEGIGINLNDARGIEKHWIVAIEKSTVIWVEDKKLGKMDKEACVLLKSNENPDIYYVYNHLYNRNIEVKKGQKLMRGELIGTAWGDDKWGHLQLLVVKSDTVPSYEERFHNSVNFFPQLYELYFKQSYSFSKSFSRGKIEFGKSAEFNRSGKNTFAFEEYAGKGWLLGKWNTADKVESVSRGFEGNARLQKVVRAGSKAQSRNPNNYFDYEINVKNGVYRVRAKVGDLYLPTWQKIEFEGIKAATYSLGAGEQTWTTERVVKIKDRKLKIRIYIDEENKKVAGLSEIVFQRAY